MSDENGTTTLLTKVKSWFKRPSEPDLLPPIRSVDPTQTDIEPKTSIFRPWGKRDQAIVSLQHGFNTLTDLMSGIRENLEKQGKRQDELLEHLSRLPAVLEQLPEASRLHGETLKALHQELSAQHVQQERLTEILDHVSKNSTSHKEQLEGMTEHLDRSRQTHEQIATNLTSVGSAMQELGRSTGAGAQILESLRDNMTARDNELQQILSKQGARFTVMLSVAIFLSIAALVAVAIVGYLAYIHGPVK